MKERWFVTGDCHGDLSKIWRFIKRFDLSSETNIIVCGDMGVFWNKEQNDARYMIKQYEENCNGVNLYWIDGNHENFDIINSWETKDIYNNSEHIHYCPRGTVLNINGKKGLCLGGADSIDRAWRKEGLSWWPQEQITEKDIENISGKYEYVFTHCCPYSVFNFNRGFLCAHGGEMRDITHKSEEMLEQLRNNITFNKWYFGHYHIDLPLSENFICLYNTFIELE